MQDGKEIAAALIKCEFVQEFLLAFYYYYKGTKVQVEKYHRMVILNQSGFFVDSLL